MGVIAAIIVCVKPARPILPQKILFKIFVRFQMPRTYRRKSHRACWSSEALQAALKAIENGRYIREVSRTFAIPRATLQDHRKNKRVSKPQLGRRPVFTQQQERELSEQIINLSKFIFGITAAQIQHSAYTFSELNHLENRFNEENKSAGRDWLEGFLRRNPQVRLRKPESTSVNRVTAFNKEEMGLFFWKPKHSNGKIQIFSNANI